MCVSVRYDLEETHAYNCKICRIALRMGNVSTRLRRFFVYLRGLRLFRHELVVAVHLLSYKVIVEIERPPKFFGMQIDLSFKKIRDTSASGFSQVMLRPENLRALPPAVEVCAFSTLQSTLVGTIRALKSIASQCYSIHLPLLEFANTLYASSIICMKRPGASNNVQERG